MSWKLEKIEDHAELVSRGKAPKYGDSTDFMVVKSAQVRTDKIDWEECQKLSQEFGEKCPLKFLLQEGDVLLNGTGTGTLGRPGIVRGMPKGNCYVPDSHVNLIRTKESLEPKFLYYWLISPNGQRIIDKSYTGSTNQIELASSRVGKFRIPLPPLEEQKKIAAILDEADALRQKDKALIAKYEELTQSLFLDMFGDTWTNPNGYDLVKLSDLVKNSKIITYGIVQAGPHVEGGIPYIRTGDLSDGEIKMEGLLRTSEEIAKSFERSKCSVGDIIMSIRATVGTIAFLPPELDGSNLTQGTARISPDPLKGNPIYIYHCIKSNGIQLKIDNETKGATFREITLGRLREVKIPVPLLKFQNQFAERIQQIEKKKQLALQSLQKSEELFNSLLQRAFKGELTKSLELA